MINKKYSIDARKIKEILENRSGFSEWIKTHIRKNELQENKDYYIQKEDVGFSKNKVTKINYFLTVEASEKIIANCHKGKNLQKIKEKLKKKIPLQNILEQIQEKEEDITIIRIDEKEYPNQLKNIKNPPKQLYVKGNIDNLREYGLAVIGSRHCSNYGRKICIEFTKNLVSYNLIIISGLAVGIDSCAHRACLEVKGKTIAVLPSGLNNIYPKNNKDLLNRIIENGGTVISEYPPDFEKTSESCRERNRIISGLAIGTLVIEAEERTGTSITVDFTNKQGKKAFAIPSSLLNSKGIGTNKMIKQNRAKIVTKVEDIIKEYKDLKLERNQKFELNNVQKSPKKVKKQIIIDLENLEIYNVLGKEPKDIDEISKLVNKPINEVSYKLTILELQGAIEELPGKKFRIIR